MPVSFLAGLGVRFMYQSVGLVRLSLGVQTVMTRHVNGPHAECDRPLPYSLQSPESSRLSLDLPLLRSVCLSLSPHSSDVIVPYNLWVGLRWSTKRENKRLLEYTNLALFIISFSATVRRAANRLQMIGAHAQVRTSRHTTFLRHVHT
jgi:hypothetical protein